MHGCFGGDEHLFKNKRGSGYHIGNGFNLIDQVRIPFHVIATTFLDDHMRSRAKDFRLEILLKAGHDAKRANECCDTKRNPGDGDKRVQRNRSLPTFGPKIPQSD